MKLYRTKSRKRVDVERCWKNRQGKSQAQYGKRREKHRRQRHQRYMKTLKLLTLAYEIASEIPKPSGIDLRKDIGLTLEWEPEVPCM